MNPKLYYLGMALGLLDYERYTRYLFTFEEGIFHAYGFTETRQENLPVVSLEMLLQFLEFTCDLKFIIARDDPKYLYLADSEKKIISFQLIYPDGLLQLESPTKLETINISNSLETWIRSKLF